jgi:hypothetical protein
MERCRSRPGFRSMESASEPLPDRELVERRKRQDERRKHNRSKVTNGRALFLNGSIKTAASRRFADILSAIVGDLGGADAPLSEGQKQLARRAASLSLACEKLEAQLVGQPEALEERIKALAGGLTPHQILGECGRLMHAVARHRGGSDGVAAIAALPDAQLTVVTDLLKAAADISAKAIAAGSEHGADLELLGMLADRCGRTFMRLGLKRQARDISASFSDGLARTDLRADLAGDVVDAEPPTLDAEPSP